MADQGLSYAIRPATADDELNAILSAVLDAARSARGGLALVTQIWGEDISPDLIAESLRGDIAASRLWIAEADDRVLGCGALHVLWADLGEVRTVAVDPSVKGRGIGHAIVDRLLQVARELQLRRLFVLTFETDFFGRHGFTEIEGTPVNAEVYEEIRRSYDVGVAEFLDLSYVKPNILGNTRMLLVL